MYISYICRKNINIKYKILVKDSKIYKKIGVQLNQMLVKYGMYSKVKRND
jgi:sugar phosphate permease